MCALLCVRLFTFELRRIDIDTGWLDRFGVNLFFELRFARDRINLQTGEVTILYRRKKEKLRTRIKM